MPLRFRLTATTINPDKTLTVTADLVWADQTGTEVWKQTVQQVYSGDVTVQQVLSDLQQIANSQAGVIAARVGLTALVGKTFERQSDGTWKAI